VTALNEFPRSSSSESHTAVTTAGTLHDDNFPDSEHNHQALGVIVKVFGSCFFFLHINFAFVADGFFIFKGLHMDGLYKVGNPVIIW
jgi:hypothetical protein